MGHSLWCDICSKQHNSADNTYRYWSGHTFCVDHPGVKEWYEGAIKIADFKISFVMSREGYTFREVL